MTAPDVAIVGGGAIGLAAAWRCAQRGLSVEVLDPDPGSGASGVAAGMLAPVTEARLGEEAALRLGLAAWSRWPAFAAELAEFSVPSGPGSLSYRSEGTVLVAVDADDRALLADVVDRQRCLGLDVADLSVGELRDLEPALAPGIRRGAMASGERSVDPAALVAALLVAAERAGVVVRREAVHDLTSVEAGSVVLAAGAWSGELLDIPVRPVKGQVLTLRQRPGETLAHHTVRGFVRGSDIYLVPRDDGRVVCGATVEEKGWDTTPTLGAAYELLRDVLTVFPGLDEAEVVGVRAGLRPGTPDDLPLIGESGTNGLLLATGHYRNGILLTPITAEAVVALVLGESLPEELSACDPGRFRPSVRADS